MSTSRVQQRRRIVLLAAVIVVAIVVTALASRSGEPARSHAAGSPAHPLTATTSTGAASSDETGTTGGKPSRSGAAPAPGESGQGAQTGGQTVAPPTTGSGAPGKPAAKAPAEQSQPRSERKQKALPPSARRPCSLVTQSEAERIVGAPLVVPIEAPQGPTCIYQTRSQKLQVTLTVQHVRLGEVLPALRGSHRRAVAGHDAYCGRYGRSLIYVPLDRGRVLTVTAACTRASAFAERALSRL